MASTPKPYHDQDNNPIMKQSVIVVADILGFKNLIKKASFEGNEDAELQKLHNALDEAYEYLKSLGGAKGFVKFHVDDLIAGYPYLDNGKGQFEFHQACYNIGHFQLELANHGYFIRGGIGIGHIHMGDRLIFGSVMDKMSKAESLACYPRIILLRSAIDYIQKYPGPPELSGILRPDSDAVFINYLFPLGAGTDSIRTRMIGEHKRIIESRLGEFRHYAEDNRIYKKYEWAANYHNRFCRESRHWNDDRYMIAIR